MHCRIIVALALCLAGAGCGPQTHEAGVEPPEAIIEATPEAIIEATAAGAAAGAATGAASAEPGDVGPPVEPAPAPRQDILVVTDRDALAVLAAAGGDLGSVLHGQPAGDNRALAAHPAYAAMAAAIERDLDATDRADPDAGVGIRGHIHRLFDSAWLRSPDARYELIGLVHRIDLIPVRPGECGEIHFIYRLAYTKQISGEPVSSRLPMTVAVIVPGLARAGNASDASDANARCGHAAAAWRAPAGLEGEALGAWLISPQGPLDRDLMVPERVERVRVNLQSVRWPSSVRPDLGGHAEYTMYSFRPAPGKRGQRVMIPGPLENTPDVAHLQKNRALRAELLAWIQQNLDGIAQGTARIPDQFLARSVVSVTPRGLSRRANRPFRQIFAPRDFDSIPDLHGRAIIGSAQALLRRLDDLTCAGCHQSRTIAGFHLLGDDGDDVAPGNALAVSMSAHLIDEIDRRAAIARALAAGEKPDYTRPFAERGPREPGTLGARCALPAADESVDPGFGHWTCAPGFTCAAYDVPDDDAAIGTCLPEGEMDIGGPCEFGPIKPSANPHRDRARNRAAATCAGGAVCNINRTGFPGGMCTASCAAVPGSGTCGVIAVLEPFNNCLARKTPFPRCLAEHVTPAGLRACDARTPCRDDYICARVPGGERRDQGDQRGACMPPYFLFQMRVDGHPH